MKAKKKLTVEKDYLLGQKSLWHSFRIVDFAIQILKTGKIENYSSCNDLYWEILIMFNWDEIFNVYKQKHNNILSEFRLLSPK